MTTSPASPEVRAGPSGASARLLRWLRLLLTIAVIVLCLSVLRGIEFSGVLQTLQHAAYAPVLAAVALNLTGVLWTRIERYRALLAPLPRRGPLPGRLRLAGVILSSYTANNLLPARSGEAVRVLLLRGPQGFAVPDLVAAALLERVVEALSLSLAALAVVLLGHPPAALRWTLLAFGVAAPAILGALVLVARVMRRRSDWAEAAPEASLLRRGLSAVRRFIVQLSDALHLLHRPRTLLIVLGWTLALDFLDAAMIGLCLRAVGIHAGLDVQFLVLIIVNLSLIVPAAPGQIGQVEASAVLVLRTLGVEGGAALSFAILYHAAHLVPSTLVGAVALYLQRGRLIATPQAPVEVPLGPSDQEAPADAGPERVGDAPRQSLP